MEAAGPGVSGSAGDAATAPQVFEDDSRHGHFAASQAFKPSSATSPPPLNAGSPADGSIKDVKSLGTRFHEDCHEPDSHGPRLKSSRHFKGKGKDLLGLDREKKEPLQLLDLPVDILKDIVKEVTHTNDLTSLARCHSALHRLTIPHIYSRFDIVWPDSSPQAEPRSGVDALTYGLATLVMAEEIFNPKPHHPAGDNNRFTPTGRGRASELTVRRRIGNHYAQYTRKFSLGNGPAEWVSEYLITKEGGKMLGTLVALAVARMQSLETFVWDMPTGILRDVWLCLASLGDRPDGIPCKLEKVWVRWHDNSAIDAAVPFAAPTAFPPNVDDNVAVHAPPPPPPPHPPIGHVMADSFAAPQMHAGSLDRVEHPSFSVLPPLKSLSVLDIDELAYLDEMAVLIGKSLDKLRELRVGIARHATTREWANVFVGNTVQQVDPDYPTAGSVTIGERRLGGVLGTLTGFVCDMRKPKTVITERSRRHYPSSTTVSPATPTRIASLLSSRPSGTAGESSVLEGISSLRDSLPDESGTTAPLSVTGDQALLYNTRSSMATESQDTESAPNTPMERMRTNSSHSEAPLPSDLSSPLVKDLSIVEEDEEEPAQHYLEHVLHLDNLELERVPLWVPVLQKAIDWTRLTSLTLLYCINHEPLWKALKKSFAPSPRSPTYPQAHHAPFSPIKRGSRISSAGKDIHMEYPLKLKKVHTNSVSPSLIGFLKDTLAPNSLEVLFLQDSRNYLSPVTIDHIYKGPLRRHRNSLKKVLIDSSEKGRDGLPISSTRWRKWMLSRELLNFMLSGKMPALRELGMAVDYRDWHFFLQHLPSIPHLRSLYIPFIATSGINPANLEPREQPLHLDPRELALQVVDIVALRPEVELCYMGITNKCFEILENSRDGDGRGGSGGSGNDHHGHGGAGGAGMDDSGRSDGEDEEEDDDDDDVDDGDDLPIEYEELDDTESDDDDPDAGHDSDSDSDAAPMARGAARLRLREILFYDDKVAVFKARHGRL